MDRVRPIKDILVKIHKTPLEESPEKEGSKKYDNLTVRRMVLLKMLKVVKVELLINGSQVKGKPHHIVIML